MPLKADMQLRFESSEVGKDEVVKGSARLESKDEFKVEAVRLEIRVKETWREYRPRYSSRGPAGGSNAKVTQTIYSQDVPISESFEVEKELARDFPFEVKIPVIRPTRGTIAYSIKAVANVKGRPDVTKEIEFAG